MYGEPDHFLEEYLLGSFLQSNVPNIFHIIHSKDLTSLYMVKISTVSALTIASAWREITFYLRTNNSKLLQVHSYEFKFGCASYLGPKLRNWLQKYLYNSTCLANIIWYIIMSGFWQMDIFLGHARHSQNCMDHTLSWHQLYFGILLIFLAFSCGLCLFEV